MEVSDFPFGKDPRQRSAHPPPRRHAAAVAFATRGAVASTAWGVSRLHRVGRQSSSPRGASVVFTAWGVSRIQALVILSASKSLYPTLRFLPGGLTALSPRPTKNPKPAAIRETERLLTWF